MLLKKLQEETGELFLLNEEGNDSMFNRRCEEDPVSASNVAEEAIHTLIVTLGLIHVLGFDVENLFSQKMDVNHAKYNTSRITELLDNGQTRIQALKETKELWDRKKNAGG